MSTLTDDSRPLLEVEAGLGDDSVVGDRSEPSYRALAMGWVAIATLVRLVFLAPLPLGNGEAYYYSWSRFLDWSYYDHPPLIAWMVRLTTALGSSPAAVRLGPVLAAGAFGVLFYRLAERLFRPRAAFFALVIVTAIPVFLASSFILNPEAFLAPLWVGYLLVVERMRKRDQWYLPLAAGLLLGCAFLAKYTAFLLFPATMLFLTTSSTSRHWLRRPSFYAGGAVALLLAMPVIVWNQTRGWPSLQLHLVERAGVGVPVAGENTVNQLVAISSSSGSGLLQGVGRMLVGQLMAYSPLLAPLLVLGLVRATRRLRVDDRDLFLSAFTWPVLLPLLAAMTKLRDAEQHWTMVAFIPAIILAGRYVEETWARLRAVRWMTIGGVALSGAAFVLINVHAHSTALLRLVPASHYDPRADMINELKGWDQVRSSLAQVASAAPGDVVLASNHYSLCGRVLFEMGDWPPVYCPTARRSAFDFFGRHDPPANATVIALTSDIHPDLPPGLQGRKCTVADQVDVERARLKVAHYVVQSCRPSPVDVEERASRD
jgi:hypothetical protein